MTRCLAKRIDDLSLALLHPSLKVDSQLFLAAVNVFGFFCRLLGKIGLFPSSPYLLHITHQSLVSQMNSPVFRIVRVDTRSVSVSDRWQRCR